MFDQWVSCLGCGNLVPLRLMECETGEHWHCYTVCICPYTDDEQGRIVDGTVLNEFGEIIDRS